MIKDSKASQHWRGRLLRYAPLIIWVGVVFFASSTSGSMSNTSKFIGPLLEFLFPQISKESLLLIHGFVRKFAHLVEYAVLAGFAARAFSGSSRTFLKRYWTINSLSIVALVALVDEYFQSLNMSRTGSLNDVLLDIVGGIIAISIFWSIKNYRSRATAQIP